MNNVDPHTFVNKIKRNFKSDKAYDDWLKENVFFKTFLVLVRAKNETFKGNSRLRFYAAEIVNVDASPEEDQARTQRLVASF